MGTERNILLETKTGIILKQYVRKSVLISCQLFKTHDFTLEIERLHNISSIQGRTNSTYKIRPLTNMQINTRFALCMYVCMGDLVWNVSNSMNMQNMQ